MVEVVDDRLGDGCCDSGLLAELAQRSIRYRGVVVFEMTTGLHPESALAVEDQQRLREGAVEDERGCGRVTRSVVTAHRPQIVGEVREEIPSRLLVTRRPRSECEDEPPHVSRESHRH